MFAHDTARETVVFTPVTFQCIYNVCRAGAHTIDKISILRWGSLALIDQNLYDNMTIKHIYEIDYLVCKSQ